MSTQDLEDQKFVPTWKNSIIILMMIVTRTYDVILRKKNIFFPLKFKSVCITREISYIYNLMYQEFQLIVFFHYY